MIKGQQPSSREGNRKRI